MAGFLTIVHDIQNDVLVAGTNDSTPFVTKWWQGVQRVIQYFPVRRTSNISPLYTNVELGSLTLRMGIGPRAGAESLLAAQASWAKVYTNEAQTTGYMTATLNLNTSQMNAAISTADSYETFFEVELSDAGERISTVNTPIRVLAAVFDTAGATTLPSAVEEYYTIAQQNEIFVRFGINPAGATIILVSQNSLYGRILGENNDQSALDSHIVI